MRRAIFAFLLVILLSSLACAKSAQDSRRTEEEKRDSLANTEVKIPPPQQEPAPKEEPPQLQFLNELYTKDQAQYSDAVRIIQMLLDIEDRSLDFTSQLAVLKNRGIITKDMAEKAAVDKPLSKGAAAYMFSQALGIKGGLWMRLFGPSQRYCLQELSYERIIRANGPDEPVSGQELVDIFIRSADYLVQKQGAQGKKR